MKFEYSVLIAGGKGPDTWDRELTVGGEDMTIREALEQIEAGLEGDAAVVSIEQVY